MADSLGQGITLPLPTLDMAQNESVLNMTGKEDDLKIGSGSGFPYSGYGSGMPDFDFDLSALIPWHKGVSDNMVRVFAPILIITGTIGNLLVLLVLQSSLFRKTTCGFLLSALAVVDTGVLLTVLLRLWIMVLTSTPELPKGTDIREFSNAGCKAHGFFTYFFPQLSSWTLVLVTIDRVISVAIPLRAREICTQMRMIIAWCLVCVVIAAININPAYHYRLEYIHNTPMCTAPLKAVEQFRDNHGWLDFCFLALVPIVIIVASNCFIVYQMFQAQIRRMVSLNASSRSTNRGERSGNRSSNRTSSATIMLITLSIVFVVTTLPRSIYFLGLPWDSIGGDFMEHRGKLDLFNRTVLLIYCISNAINFLLYCLSGSKFRKAIVNIIRGREGFLSRQTSFFSSRNTRTSLMSSSGSKKVRSKPICQNNNAVEPKSIGMDSTAQSQTLADTPL